jgi:hypothetical protein
MDNVKKITITREMVEHIKDAVIVFREEEKTA